MTHDDRDKPLSGAWWRFPKWLWRYVMSVFRVQGMVKRRADSSMSFAVFHPFLNLTEELAKSFSPQEVSLSASSFVENNRVSTELRQRGPSSAKSPPTCPRCRLHKYAVFNACTLFHSDVMVHQGNQRLPQRMLKISEASVRLNTHVSRITTGEIRRWQFGSILNKGCRIYTRGPEALINTIVCH